MSSLVTVSIFRPTVVRKGKAGGSDKREQTIVWWLAYRHPKTNKRKRESSGTSDVTAARQAAAALSKKLTAIRDGVYDEVADNSTKPWSAIAAEFMNLLRKRVGKKGKSAVSSETVRIYEDVFAAFARVAEPKTAADISTKLIEEFAANRLAETAVPHRVARIVGRLRAALDWAVQHGKKLNTEALIGQSRCVRGLLRSALKWQEANGPIAAEKIDEFEAAARVSVIKPATINKQLRHLRAVCRWAKRRHYIRRVPKFKRAFAREDRKIPVVVSLDEYQRLLAAVDVVKLYQRDRAWWRLFLRLSYALGTRRGETLGIRWRDVNLVASEVFVSSTISKGRRDRNVSLTDELRQELAAARGVTGPDDFVLPWPSKSLSALYPEWRRIRKAAGITRRVVPHHCRSSVASQMIEAGVPTLVVRDQLGHASVKTTESAYATVSKLALRNAAKSRQNHLRTPEAG